MIEQETERFESDVEEAAFPRIHPEDRPEAEPEKPGIEKRLWSVLPLSVLAGLIGMTYGAAALSSALSYGTIMEVVSLIPLVAALVTIATGWTAAMFCMTQEDPNQQ